MNWDGIVKVFSTQTENGVVQERSATACFLAPCFLLTCKNSLNDSQRRGCEKVDFKFAAQTRHQAVCIKVSEEYDLALLKTEGISPIVMYGLTVEKRQGGVYHLGGFPCKDQAVPETRSATLDMIDENEAMQLGAGVDSGFIGGPVLDDDSQVVGIICQTGEESTVALPSSIILKQFGQCIQPEMGERNVNFGPYRWRVLDVQNGNALLLSEQVLGIRPYHHNNTRTYEGTTWETCKLRAYLNGAFLQSFTASQQGQIVEVTNENPDNQWFETPGGNSTNDKVFLLSLQEAAKYFGDSGQLGSRPEGEFWIDDQFNDARMADYRKEVWMGWWLRSPGHFSFDASNVWPDGKLEVCGDRVDDEHGVRPALWLKLQSGNC